MKKLFYCLALSFSLPIILFANPIESPIALISEVKIEDQNNWILELFFSSSMPFSHQYYDSICVETSAGVSKINIDNVPDNITLLVVYSDSLLTKLPINRQKDFIKVLSYFNTWGWVSDFLSFGDYDGATIKDFMPGYSISRIGYQYGYRYSLDKSPTPGLPNDNEGVFGKLEGYLYDKDNNLVTRGEFIIDEPLQLEDNGHYTANVYSNSFLYNSIYIIRANGSYSSILIDTIKLNIYPDSIYSVDIHLKSAYVDVKQELTEPDYDIRIINYPNPFNSTTSFVIKVPASLQNQERKIFIYDSNGRKIRTIDMSNSLRSEWNGTNENGSLVSSGIYYYQLISGNKIYSNGSMVLLK